MATNLVRNGLAEGNDILKQDANKGRVAVHSFDAAASPAEKGAAAGKARDQLKSVTDQPAAGGRGWFDVYNMFCEIQGLTSSTQLYSSRKATLVLCLQSQCKTLTQSQTRQPPRLPLNRFKTSGTVPRSSLVTYRHTSLLQFLLGIKSVGDKCLALTTPLSKKARRRTRGSLTYSYPSNSMEVGTIMRLLSSL